MDASIKLIRFDKFTGEGTFVELDDTGCINRKIYTSLFDMRDSGKGYECKNFKLEANGACRFNCTFYDSIEDMLDGISSAEKKRLLSEDIDAYLASIKIMIEAGASGIQKFVTEGNKEFYKIVDSESNIATVIIPRDLLTTELRHTSSIWNSNEPVYDKVYVIGGGLELFNLESLFMLLKCRELDVSKLCVRNVQKIDKLFSYASIENLDLSWTFGCKIDSADMMFYKYCGEVIDLNKFNGKHITELYYTFSGTKAKIVGKFDTSNVDEMTETFSCISSGDKLDLTWMNVSKVMNMRGVFSNCQDVEIDITGWNTSNVKHAIEMFKNCKSKIIGLNELDFNRLECANNMFNGAIWGRKLSLDNMSWANIKDAENMFYMAKIREIDLVKFGLTGPGNRNQMSKMKGSRNVDGIFDCFVGKIKISAYNCCTELRGLAYKAKSIYGEGSKPVIELVE